MNMCSVYGVEWKTQIPVSQWARSTSNSYKTHDKSQNRETFGYIGVNFPEARAGGFRPHWVYVLKVLDVRALRLDLLTH